MKLRKTQAKYVVYKAHPTLGSKFFNSLPRSITSSKNEKTQFRIALKNIYMHTSLTLWMNFSHVQMICIAN
jgi:hypothetical protein